MSEVLKHEIPLGRVIVFQDPKNEEWEWSACAIDLGQWAFGDTREGAHKLLVKLATSQLRFLLTKRAVGIFGEHPLKLEWLENLWEAGDLDGSEGFFVPNESNHGSDVDQRIVAIQQSQQSSASVSLNRAA